MVSHPIPIRPWRQAMLVPLGKNSKSLRPRPPTLRGIEDGYGYIYIFTYIYIYVYVTQCHVMYWNLINKYIYICIYIYVYIYNIN